MARWVALKKSDWNSLMVKRKKALEDSGQLGNDETLTLQLGINNEWKERLRGDDGVEEWVEMVEVHVDALPISQYRQGRPSRKFNPLSVDKSKCELHSADMCKCDKELVHEGQDECIFHLYLTPKNVWKVAGQHGLQKKGNRPGRMVLAFCSDKRSFGVPLTREELQRFNNFACGSGEAKGAAVARN